MRPLNQTVFPYRQSLNGLCFVLFFLWLFFSQKLLAAPLPEESANAVSSLNSQSQSQFNPSPLKLEGSDIYKEFFSKFAVLAAKFILLAFLAYLLIHNAYFQAMLKAGCFTPRGKLILIILIPTIAILLSAFGGSIYGNYAWALADVHVISVIIGGLLLGFWPGLAIGIILAAFRLIVISKSAFYALLLISAALLSGMLSRGMKNYRAPGKISFTAGLLIGLSMGIFVYLPMSQLLSWNFILFSILLLGIVKGASVFVFFAVIAAKLREIDRHEATEELFKTRFLFLQAQIRPHFLYNALGTISALCAQENAFQAQGLVLKLAEFLRLIFKRFDDTVTLREEMAHIDSYLEIEKVRYQNRLRVEKEMNIPEQVWNLKIPLFVLQPLVENAIKHGVSKKEGGGMISIRMIPKDDVLQIDVSDDGPGITPERWADVLAGKNRNEQSGIGIQNINERLIRFFGPAHALECKTGLSTGCCFSVRIPIPTIKEVKS